MTVRVLPLLPFIPIFFIFAFGTPMALMGIGCDNKKIRKFVEKWERCI